MKKLIFGLLMITVGLMSCKQQLIKRDTPSTPAKAVYVGSQINELKTDGRLPKEELIIDELLTIRGDRYQGRLFQITDADVLISEGYTTETVGTRTFKEERLVEIRKDELLIVKMW